METDASTGEAGETEHEVTTEGNQVNEGASTSNAEDMDVPQKYPEKCMKLHTIDVVRL